MASVSRRPVWEKEYWMSKRGKNAQAWLGSNAVKPRMVARPPSSLIVSCVRCLWAWHNPERSLTSAILSWAAGDFALPWSSRLAFKLFGICRNKSFGETKVRVCQTPTNIKTNAGELEFGVGVLMVALTMGWIGSGGTWRSFSMSCTRMKDMRTMDCQSMKTSSGSLGESWSSRDISFGRRSRMRETDGGCKFGELSRTLRIISWEGETGWDDLWWHKVVERQSHDPKKAAVVRGWDTYVCWEA